MKNIYDGRLECGEKIWGCSCPVVQVDEKGDVLAFDSERPDEIARFSREGFSKLLENASAIKEKLGTA